jgi:hypothetical protein
MTPTERPRGKGVEEKPDRSSKKFGTVSNNATYKQFQKGEEITK